MVVRPRVLISFALCLFILSGCSKDSSPTSPGGTKPASKIYVGTFANTTESGLISLTIAGSSNLPKGASVVTVTGSFKPTGSSTIPLSGTFNTTTDSLLVTGGTSPNIYTFAGVLAGGVLSGIYTGPAGSGSFTLTLTSNNAVKVFLGTYASQVDDGSGNFNLVRDGTTLTGLALTGSTEIPLDGFTTAESIKIYIPNSTTEFLALGKFVNTADTSATGMYDNHQGDHGTWTCTIAH